MPTFADLRPLTADLPPLVLLSSLDFGGAGIAARRLLEGLLAAGADARMICLQKKSNLPQVGELKHPQTGQPLWNYDAQLRGEVLRNYPHRPAGAEMFSLTKSLVNLAEFDLVKNAPLVHLHWVAGLVGFPQAREVFAGKKLVWTLHDKNPFTGGCHIIEGCEKWKTAGCHECPQLGAPLPTIDYDLVAANFVNKYDGYQGLDLNVVTLSRKFYQFAGESLLLQQFPRETIPNGFPLNEFYPQQPDNARYLLGLPDDRKIILFGADGVGNRNKGLHLLIEALRQLAGRWAGKPPLLAIIGNAAAAPQLPPEYEVRLLGRMDAPTQLATAYSAADVFVLPSREDNLPNMLIEAQACGTPGVGFAIEGVLDIIQDGVTGYFAAPENVADLAAKIKQILTLPSADHEKMRENCRAHALANYAPELQVERYLQLYRRLLGLPEKTATATPPASPSNPAPLAPAQPQISVIIPVYNTEKYLRRCLDSVLKQTLREIEIIGVNDCSPDNSLAILREYAARDARIKIIDFPENKGVSVARNAGIDAALGEYLGFVDSDDTLDLNFYEKLYAAAQTSGAEIVKGNAREVDAQGRIILNRINELIKTHKMFFVGCWWSAIYKTSFIKNKQITFPPGFTAGQDACFLIQAVSQANRVATGDDVYYNYMRQENSTTYALTAEKVFAIAESRKFIIDYLNSLTIDAEGYLITFNEQTHILVHHYERETDPKIRRRLVEYLQYFYSKCRHPQQVRRYDLQLPATGANTGSAPKVSVIIPIYNVEPYLRQCLDSVVNQTLKEVEIIGIDDGSTDNSLAILREYAAKDERIKVVALPKNGGVSAARNVGLASATGEYLGFIDSDDYIDLNFYEALYRQAQTGGADIVKCRRKEIGLDGKVVIDELNLNARVAKNKIYFTHEWTTAIYRAALIRARQVECPVGVVFGEDTCFLLKAVYYANRVDLIDNVYYTYLRRDNSASKAGGGHKGKETAIKIPAFRYIVDFINSVPMDENEYRFRFNICAYQVSAGIRLGGGDSTEVARALTDFARELDSKNKYRQVSPLAKNLGAAVAGKPNGLSFIELSPLVENLPAVVTLAATDFIGATPNLATQIHFGLVKSGANTQMVTLWKKTNIPTIGELQNNGKPLYHSVRGAGVNAHFDLRQIADLLNRAGLLHFFDIRGLVEFSLAAPLLRGKKIVWTLENILQLADADALTTIGEPPLNIIITTPTDELAAQVKQHPALKNFSVIAIPSGDDDRSRMTALTLYLQLYRHFWGLPEKIIMPEALMQKVSTPMQAGAIGDALALYDAHRRNLAINQPSAALAEFDELIAQMKELLAKQKLSATAMPSPAISVLVPVYKVEKYLRKCLDSILAQTFTDFELILVDDASPDDCGKICDEYAAKDPRIKVIHKPQNEGLPQARKTGFAASRGAYIQFVDSDDWLEPDMLAKMFYAAVSGDCDLVYSDYWEHSASADGTITQEYANLGRSIDADKITNINECVLHRSKTARWNCVVWNKLYRRSVVAAIKFPTASRAEDHYITCQTLYYADKIAYTPFALYHYQRQNMQSIMNAPARSEKNYREMREIFTQVEQFLREKFGEDFAMFAPTLKHRMADVEKQNPDYRPVNHVYDEGFYSRHLAGSLSSARTVLPLVVNLVKPQSVCDVGCGTGAWLKTCAEIAGIADENTIGFDFDVPVSQLLIKQQQYRNTDLKIPVVCERKFDLCISVEVAEHIPHKQSEIFVQSLVDLAPVILFSAAVPGQGGTEHINEQWPLYWEQIFRKKNYYGIDLLRSQIWDNNRIDWWYRQNIVLFVREDKLAELGLEKPQSFLLPLVHPQSKQWRRAERQPVGIINPDTIPLHRDVFGPYKNCFQGKDCVVLGTGPTLNSYQPLKDAIHIGVNGAVLYDKVNLDYYFLVNYLSVEVFFKKVVASSAQKFIGQHIDYSRRKFAVPQEKCNQSNARIFGLRQYWGDSEMQLFESQGGELNPDLLNAPMTILDGSATMGIQFALWGHAKRIFIVGCDGRSQDPSTIYAYFDGHPNALHRMATYKVSTSSMGKALLIAEVNMRKIKELRDKHYHDTEIISINPVQYKGLFDKDIYTVKD
ncbi:hypothetical protein AGMMS49959_10480 [Planctomycetales bacterium]|nr:hypothetical protein AGMMS49959_10480 [Planctomycetales bacterium]